MVDDYDKLVDSALERGENIEEYLRKRTGPTPDDDPLQRLFARCYANQQKEESCTSPNER